MKPARSNPRTETIDWELFLQIKHPSLDPDEISDTLDIQAEESMAAGPQVSSSDVRRLHGGSVTLIVDRGEREQPVVLNRCLAKLAALGIALEID